MPTRESLSLLRKDGIPERPASKLPPAPQRHTGQVYWQWTHIGCIRLGERMHTRPGSSRHRTSDRPAPSRILASSRGMVLRGSRALSSHIVLAGSKWPLVVSSTIPMDPTALSTGRTSAGSRLECVFGHGLGLGLRELIRGRRIRHTCHCGFDTLTKIINIRFYASGVERTTPFILSRGGVTSYKMGNEIHIHRTKVCTSI